VNKTLVQFVEYLVGKPSFRNWCVGDEPKKDSSTWKKWRLQSEMHHKAFTIAKEIVLELELDTKISSDKKVKAWERIETKIQKKSDQPDINTFKPVGNKSIEGWVYTAAAAVLLLVISFTVIRHLGITTAKEHTASTPSFLTVATDYNEQKVIRLESGTEIILNANSTLRYRDGWIHDKKVLVELDGEAYFDVAKRASKSDPVFQVETDDGKIKVLGTRFLVNTWTEFTGVVLEEGRVAIDKAGKKNQYSGDTILKPNEQAEFNRFSSEVYIQGVNPEVFTSWRKGFFVFDQTTLLSAIPRIEHTFGLDLVIADPTLLTRKLSGSIENKNAAFVMAAISKILEAPVVTTEGKIIVGTPVFYPLSLNQPANLNGEYNE
jgi:ferric-dicitrate binding protein FerR (iron transport regulator)